MNLDDIGIVGQGFVGTAIKEGMSKVVTSLLLKIQS